MDKIKSGNISVEAKNIMPVIKKWLYSDKDIFIREMVSNASDAITKYKVMGLGGDENLSITVTLDKENGNLIFQDNGIGMTADELDKYINQVAFSGAQEFVKSYAGSEDAGIIGHFGLGFYSAFMAADKVSIDTLSYIEGATPVYWESEDGMSFTMQDGSRQEHGTTITLHIMEEEQEFLSAYRVRETLDKYCAYMPIPIYFVDIEGEKEALKAYEKRKEEHNKKLEEAVKKGETPPEFTEESPDAKEREPINEVSPLWFKAPKDCTDEEYIETYRKLFRTPEKPLFWIHLNVDYPFNLKGILYFPHIRRDFAGQEGEIKLYNRQVFVADNIKEIVPEFLMVLKGVIDCPDLPLNVSRSFLQNDRQVRQISRHIAKKVADKLNDMFKNDRKTYESYWDDIHPFIKYGCMRDDSFNTAIKDSIILKTTSGDYYTYEEYFSKNEGKVGKKIYYTIDPARQAASVELYTSQGVDVVVVDSLIDNNYMSFVEYSGEEAPKFLRVDADIEGIKHDGDEESSLSQEDMQTLFRNSLGIEDLEVKLSPLADESLCAFITEDEQMRRFKELSVLYGQNAMFPDKFSLVLNSRNPSIKAIAAMEDKPMQDLLIGQVYDLARMSSKPLENEDLQNFLARSRDMVSMLAGVKVEPKEQKEEESANDDKSEENSVE
ncbi:MAG: molecular chaperone HtpG [Christensenellaceae bacterium]|nr:molecular chaperone HtpG [Christensenellaceae bacterium]